MMKKKLPLNASELLSEDFGSHILANAVCYIRSHVLLDKLRVIIGRQTHFLLQRINHGSELFVRDRGFAH